MKAHVSLINRSAYPQLKNVRAIKPFLDMEAANTTAHTFVSPHLGAGNGYFEWYYTRPTLMDSKDTEHCC